MCSSGFPVSGQQRLNSVLSVNKERFIQVYIYLQVIHAVRVCLLRARACVCVCVCVVSYNLAVRMCVSL